MAVIQHQAIQLSSGLLTSVAWGNHALQTITIARNTPRNPQQAIGYKGIVDYTSAAATSDITLDCILVEGGSVAASGSSVYTYANITTGYILTSCNLGFTTAAPATVSFGYQVAGSAAALATLGNPAVSDGDVFAMVLGDDGLGLAVSPSGTGAAASGIQSINFASTVNRNQVLDVRWVTPIEFITTYPLDITMNVETFADFSIDASTGNNKLSVLQALPSVVEYVRISGLQKVTENETINVGGYLTKTHNYIGSDLWLPLQVVP